VGLRCIIPPRHLNQLKTRAIPLISTPSGKELCRLSYIFSRDMHRLYISHEKYIKDVKVLAHLGFMLKVFAGPLTDLSA
jgi:hypothetical protein